MACLTAYIIYFCAETHYEKCLKKVSRFVHEQNEQVLMKSLVQYFSLIFAGLDKARLVDHRPS